MKIFWWNKTGSEAVALAAESILAGGVIINPTETIHGFAARYNNPGSIRKIIALKGRDDCKPMNILVPSADWLEKLGGSVPERVYRLAEKFWPGGLSIVIRLKENTGLQFPWEGNSISLRVSSHPFVMQMMEATGMPLVSTSLNASGSEALTGDYQSSLNGLENIWQKNRLEMPVFAVIDNKLVGKQPSSVIAVNGDGTIRMIREGLISTDEIENTL